MPSELAWPDESSFVERVETSGAVPPPLLSDPQPASEHPVGNEWFAFIPGIDEFRELSTLGYVEWQRRIAACMADRGFNYVPIEFVDSRNVDLFRALNPLNEQAAMTWAFHVPQTAEPLDLNQESDAAYSRALSGANDDPSTGCGTLANKIAYGAIDPINDDYSTLVAELSSQLERHASLPEAVDLRDRWSQCMTVRGYTFASFDDAYANYGSRPEITSDERLARATSIECDRQAGVTAQKSQWQRSRFDAWLDSNAVTLTQLDEKTKVATRTLAELANERLEEG